MDWIEVSTKQVYHIDDQQQSTETLYGKDNIPHGKWSITVHEMGGPLPLPGLRDGSRPSCGDEDGRRSIQDGSGEDLVEPVNQLAETGCHQKIRLTKTGVHPEDHATKPQLGKEHGRRGEGNGKDGVPTLMEDHHIFLLCAVRKGGLGLPNMENDLDMGWAYRFLISKDLMMCARCLRDTIAMRPLP